MRSGNTHHGRSEHCLGLKLLPNMPTSTAHEYEFRKRAHMSYNVDYMAISNYEHARQT